MTPPSSLHPRSTRDSDADDEDDERRVSRGCTLQYQRALVKVLTQFHTTSTEGTDQVITMLGPDWQVDVTDLVQDFLKVADPRIAELVDRTILVGLELGSSTLKVGGGGRDVTRSGGKHCAHTTRWPNIRQTVNV